jgi:hypothetical protein
MGQSYRIKTDIGVNKTINVDLEQDFEFLEIFFDIFDYSLFGFL